MPAAGRILRGSVSSVNGPDTSGNAGVHIGINGRILICHNIMKLAELYSETVVFSPSIEVVQNYRITFQTSGPTSNATRYTLNRVRYVKCTYLITK